MDILNSFISSYIQSSFDISLSSQIQAGQNQFHLHWTPLISQREFSSHHPHSFKKFTIFFNPLEFLLTLFLYLLYTIFNKSFYLLLQNVSLVLMMVLLLIVEIWKLFKYPKLEKQLSKQWYIHKTDC